MKRIALLLLIALPMLALPMLAQSVILNNPGTKGSVVIRNATIYPVSAPPVANGSIAFTNGVITAIGTNVDVPSSATVIDGTGLSVYPGLIDAGSTVGLTEVESVAGTVDTTEIGDINPNARAEVAVNPHSNVIPVTRVNGITTVLTVPEGGIVSGQSALMQLAGWTPPEMTLKAPVGMHIRFPRLRSAPLTTFESDEDAEKELRKNYTKQLDRLRDVFRDAQAYAKAANAKARRFDRDVKLEALVPVVEGRMPVMVEANIARDIKAALEFVDEFKLKAVLVGAQDVRSFIPDLKRRNIPVILGPILALPAREDDAYDLLFSNALALHEAGIRFAIRSNDAHNARNLPYNAASCAAFGLPKEEALKSITVYPAEIFGVADRIGSLAPGKVANVIVTDGDPLEIRTNVKRVFIGGEEIPMDSYHTLLYEKFKKRP